MLIYLLHTGSFNGSSTPAGRVSPAFGGKKVFGIGDSIMAGANATSYATSWLPQLAAAANGTIQNAAVAGKSLQAVEGQTYFNVNDIVQQDGTFSHMILALSANDIIQGAPVGYTWWLGKEALEAFVDHAVSVKGWQASQIVLAGPYHFKYSHLPGAVKNPWYEQDYNDMTRAVAIAKGCIYADVKGYMEAQADPDSLIADAVHPLQPGHDVIADYYIDVLDWQAAQAATADPLEVTGPYSGTATEGKTFAAAGVTATDIAIIYKTSDPAQNYVPGRGTNTITGLESGVQYTIVPQFRATFNRGTVTLPAPDSPNTSGATEAAAYVSATGRTSMQTAVETFIGGLKAANLWHRCFGFWILGGSLNASKYNVRNTATGTLTEIGAGTWSADGWTGGLSLGLDTNLSLDSYSSEGTYYVTIKTNVAEDGYDVGDSKGFIQSRTAAGSVYSGFNGATGWGVSAADAAGRLAVVGRSGFFSGYKNGIAFNPYWEIAAPSGLGNMIIGNAKDRTQGSTKKIRCAGMFHFLSDYELYQLDELVTDLEAAIV